MAIHSRYILRQICYYQYALHITFSNGQCIIRFISHNSLVGGAFVGVAFATSGLSQEIKDRLIPDDTTPIAAFLTNPTETDSRINATSATFSEKSLPSGYISYLINATRMNRGGF